ncbi:hypothetical protein HQN87_03240 [Paenibacillus tritici]|uniref:Uncharacterized protein n=1 Tax=Paenibacillus tritici TaxID=1873425 RepID=A0ABX2DI88_9BACL|nr:hypothetical protein [Paenibacillus tritici]NQX44336.1 hypothetical protein [Paenibacillus tritici]
MNTNALFSNGLPMSIKQAPTNDLNQLRDTGIYLSSGYGAQHGPNSDGAWTLQVLRTTAGSTTFFLQSFYTDHGIWQRVGELIENIFVIWYDWHSQLKMRATQYIVSDDNDPGIEIKNLTKTGFYNSDKYEMGESPPIGNIYTGGVLSLDFNNGYWLQYFYEDYALYWRYGSRDNGGGVSWGNWKLMDEYYNNGLFLSAELPAGTVVDTDEWIPFVPGRADQKILLDPETGELIVPQSGAYTLTANLVFPTNQKLVFAISVDGETPEHYASFHHQPGCSPALGSPYTGTLSDIIECTEGQRIGIKNITGCPVTLGEKQELTLNLH